MYAILILSAVFSVVAIALAIHGGRIDKKMDEVSLYRVASSLVVASILAGVICFFAIFYSLSGTGATVISSQDAIVDILGVLVTVLMGWNIISLVDFKKKADEIEYIKHDFQNVISGYMQLNFDSFMTKGMDQDLLDNCFTALNEIHSCLNDNIRQMAEDKLMDMIKRVCDEMKKNGNNWILPKKKNLYLHTLDHVDHKYCQDVREFINTASDNKQNYTANMDNNMKNYASGNHP